VSSCLDGITNWDVIARESKYRVKEMAALVGVPVRHLERFFARRYAITPSSWVKTVLATDSAELGLQGYHKNEIAVALGFTISNFSRTSARTVSPKPVRPGPAIRPRQRSSECAVSKQQMSHNDDLLSLNSTAAVGIREPDQKAGPNFNKDYSGSDHPMILPMEIPAGASNNQASAATAEARTDLIGEVNQSTSETSPSDIAYSRWKSKIEAAWRGGISNTFELANVVAAARSSLRRGEWAGLWRQEGLPFCQRKAQMLVAIGRSLSWANAHTCARLPSGWKILYQLTRLDRPAIEALIDQGIVHPKLTLAQAKQLTGIRRNRKPSRSSGVAKQFDRLRQWARRTRPVWRADECEFARNALREVLEIVGHPALASLQDRSLQNFRNQPQETPN
jgi:hypothetical protein